MIGLIAAIDLSGLLAYEDRIPWYRPEDLKRFKLTTLDSVIIMGRKTYDSIGKPLPKRTNIVISRNPTAMKNVPSGLEIYTDFLPTLGLLKSKSDKPVWIIGGAEIYRQALQSNLVDIIDLTIINSCWVPTDGLLDAKKAIYFPPIPWHYSVKEEKTNEVDTGLLHRRYEKKVW